MPRFASNVDSVSHNSTCASSADFSSDLGISCGVCGVVLSRFGVLRHLLAHFLLVLSCVHCANFFLAWMWCTNAIVLSHFASRSANFVPILPEFPSPFETRSAPHHPHSHRLYPRTSIKEHSQAPRPRFPSTNPPLAGAEPA